MTELLDDLEQVATEGHVDNIALVDTFGVTSPHAIRYYTQRVRERMAVPLETHFHMDFGMGVANTAGRGRRRIRHPHHRQRHRRTGRERPPRRRSSPCSPCTA